MAAQRGRRVYDGQRGLLTEGTPQHAGGRPRVAVVGSYNTDLAVRSPRVPARGENLTAHSLRIGLGGKGANPAVALTRLGVEAHLVACVGADDFGRRALDALRAEGVHVEGVSVIGEADTGAALIIVDDAGENTILVVNGANDRLTPAAANAALAVMYDGPDAVLVTFEIPQAAVQAAVDWGVQHNVPVIVDAGPPRRYPPRTWKGATVLSPNEVEAAALLGYAIEDDVDAVRAGRELLATGPQAVVLKLGGRGSFVCTRDTEAWMTPFQVAVVDTTGAGDAYTAGLVVGLLEGMSLVEAARLASAAGALAVTQLGTMNAMPTRAQVDALLQAHARSG